MGELDPSFVPRPTSHFNLKARRSKADPEVCAGDPNQGKVVKLDAILNQGVTTGSNVQHTVDDLHDILHSYYKVARKRFVDIVCMQAADHFLVTGHDAPIKVFSPKFVSELTNEQLEAIAGEDLVSKRKREDLKRKIENLEVGKKIALS